MLDYSEGYRNGRFDRYAGATNRHAIRTSAAYGDGYRDGSLGLPYKDTYLPMLDPRHVGAVVEEIEASLPDTTDEKEGLR